MSNKAIFKTIKKVMPAVVSISISKSLIDIEKEIPPELWQMLPFPDHHLDIPESAIDAHGRVKIGGGSGFIVKNDGTIITNKHVIADPHAEYTVITDDEKRYKARVLARDPIDDIAIIKIEGAEKNSFPIVELGNSSNLQLGQSVLAIGNALGLFKNTVSSGIISGLARSITAAPDPKSPMQELRGLIQTDSAINPGNSGGPLVDLETGKAIGINAAIVFGAQNLGFAIPVNAVRRDLEDLKKHGHIRRPLLGLRYITLDENLKEKMRLPVDYGAMIMGPKQMMPSIVPGSPADKAGLKENDIIIECDGKRLDHGKTIQDVLEEKAVDDMLKLKILRNGKEVHAEIRLAERKLAEKIGE
ncbi:MAG: trypsin-like peptidase domain-containing protein [bacterium]|nr:trypsin-like peptidase domain-containing protein [bacterium]